jgi:hypothetical protein
MFQTVDSFHLSTLYESSHSSGGSLLLPLDGNVDTQNMLLNLMVYPHATAFLFSHDLLDERHNIGDHPGPA